jgi:hypothetical protein
VKVEQSDIAHLSDEQLSGITCALLDTTTAPTPRGLEPVADFWRRVTTAVVAAHLERQAALASGEAQLTGAAPDVTPAEVEAWWRRRSGRDGGSGTPNEVGECGGGGVGRVRSPEPEAHPLARLTSRTRRQV